MATSTPQKTLRLIMPQWQGGDNGTPFPGRAYPMGAHLLAFLAPENDAPLVEIPVEPYSGLTPPKTDGILWRGAISRQLRVAWDIIDAHAPDRIIMFGGDRLVNQAPFDYLNGRYSGKLGLLWIDAHPDITTPKDFDHAHAMVLGNLIGDGDPQLASAVRHPLRPEQVLLIGVDEMLPHETETINKQGLAGVRAKEIAEGGNAVTQWIRENKFEHVAIHLDLDVLDPRSFYSVLLKNPDSEPFDTFPGKLTLPQLTRLIRDVSETANVAGIGITEYMPWDALNLKTMLDAFSFMK